MTLGTRSFGILRLSKLNQECRRTCCTSRYLISIAKVFLCSWAQGTRYLADAADLIECRGDTVLDEAHEGSGCDEPRGARNQRPEKQAGFAVPSHPTHSAFEPRCPQAQALAFTVPFYTWSTAPTTPAHARYLHADVEGHDDSPAFGFPGNNVDSGRGMRTKPDDNAENLLLAVNIVAARRRTSFIRILRAPPTDGKLSEPSPSWQ